MNVTPKAGYILVQLPEEREPQQGIWRPKSADPVTQGKVLAKGPGYVDPDTRKVVALEGFEVGDTVLWEHGGEHPVPEHPGLMLVSGAYVLAVVDS
jgi:co-chaperonin GroES (HSP10)